MNKAYEIANLLYQNDYFVKQYALDALRKFEILLPSIITELKNFFITENDLSLKIAVIKLFTQKQVLDCAEFFITNTKSDDFYLKIAILDYIAKTNSKETINYLVNQFYIEKNEYIRSKIVKTIAEITNSTSEELITNETIFDFLNDPDHRVRANACTFKIKKDNAILIAEIKKLLNDSSYRTIADAIMCLFEICPEEIIEFAIKKLSETTDSTQQSSIVYALGIMQGKISYEILKPYLKSENINLRKNTILSIGKLQFKEAIDDLIELYFNEQKNCRENLSVIISTLNLIGSYDVALNIYERLKNCDDDYKKSTYVKLLAHFANYNLVENIVSYLDDVDARVRANTVEALLILKEREIINSDFVVKNLIVSMCDKNSRVVANTIMALYSCGVSSVISILREMFLSNVKEVQNAAKYVASAFPAGLLLTA